MKTNKLESTTTFGDFFPQLSEIEIMFVINQLNQTKTFGIEISREHASTLDAKFIKSFINKLNVGTIGQIIVQSLNFRMAV